MIPVQPAINPYHRFEMIDEYGMSSGPCDYPDMRFRRQIPAPNDLTPDSFVSMLFDSNAYRRNFLYFKPSHWEFKKTVLLLMHPLYAIVNAVISLAKLVFHTAALIYRSILLRNKANDIAEKKYLENNFAINHSNINFLRNRLSYLNHRDEAVGNLLMFCKGILVTIPLLGLLLHDIVADHLQEVRKEKMNPFWIENTLIRDHDGTQLYEIHNQYFWALSVNKAIYYRSNTEKTYLIEKLANCKSFEKIDEAIRDNLKQRNEILDPYNNNMPEDVVKLIADYSVAELKKEYWQKEVWR